MVPHNRSNLPALLNTALISLLVNWWSPLISPPVPVLVIVTWVLIGLAQEDDSADG